MAKINVPHTPPTSVEVRKNIDFLLKKFAPERYAYLIAGIVAFVLLIVCIIIFMNDLSQKKTPWGREDYVYLFGMFGSGGIVGITVSRIIKIWQDCIDLIKQAH